MSADISGFEGAAESFEDLADALDEAADNVDDAVDRGVGRTARAIGDTAQDNASVDTGDLRDSKRVRRLATRRWEVAFTARSEEGYPYPRAVEYGRGPVVAQDADMLRFETDGQVFYRKSVGPAPAQPFLRPSLQRHRSTLVENIATELRRTVAAAFA